MRRMTSVELITFSPDAHEVGTPVQETKRTVKVQEMDLTQADIYQAGGEGLSPDAKLLVPYDKDYKGERELIWEGERYQIIRTNPFKEWNGVILSIKRKKGNSGGSVVNRYV